VFEIDAGTYDRASKRTQAFPEANPATATGLGRIDEALAFTTDEAAAFQTEAKKRLQAPRGGRVFNLRALVGLKESRRPRA
jgi:hypothetical protein